MILFLNDLRIFYAAKKMESEIRSFVAEILELFWEWIWNLRC